MEHDLNIWGILAVPVGVLLCFGPALIVWIRAEVNASNQEEAAARARQGHLARK
jgi:hypothetical protein